MAGTRSAPLYAAWLVTLAGGLVLIGAVASLSSGVDENAPFPSPYKLAWTAIALEVVSLLIALYALAVGPFHAWKHAVAAILATVTAVLIPLTNDVLTAKGALPGSNGSDTRANTAAAGLIIVMIGNYALILLSSLFGSEAAPAAEHASRASFEAGKEMA